MISLLKILEYGYKKLERLHERMFQWHNLKAALAMAFYLYFIDGATLNNYILEIILGFVALILIWNLFKKPQKNEIPDRDANQLTKILYRFNAKLGKIHERMFQWHGFKLFLAYFAASMVSQHFRTDYIILNVVIRVVNFLIAGLLFLDPKYRENNRT